MANQNKKIQDKYLKDKKPNGKSSSRKFKKAGKYGEDYPSSNDVGAAKSSLPSRMNDIKWYRSSDQLLNDVSRLAYNIPVGQPFRHEGTLLGPRGDNFSVPGVAVMNVVPTMGFAYAPSDPVNVAFAGMFTYIRSHTSSKFDWDDNTLGINMLATDSLYYFTKWCIRAYATLPLFHQANKYIPQTILEAQGIDYEDLLAHASEFRTQLNLRLARINALKIPSELYIFARHMWMFENYYIEGDIVKDQIYCYKPAAYYIHSKDANGLSYLACHRTEAGGTGTNGLLTASDLIRKIDAMLDPIFNDQYFNLISGYIEQAYEGKVMSIPYIPDQLMVPLINSPEVLLQFKNAKPMPVRHATTGPGYIDDWFNVTQSPASAVDPRVCLKTKLTPAGLRVYRNLETGVATDVTSTSSDFDKYNMYMIANECSKAKMLTSPHGDVTPEENMINTRLVPIYGAVPGANPAPDFAISHYAFATEWPLSVEVCTRWFDSHNNQIATIQYELHHAMIHDLTASNSFIVERRLLPTLSVFKYLPELRICVRYGSGDPDVADCENPFFEIDNMTLVDDTTLERMHESAVMSMLRVPEIASTNLGSR